MFREMRKIERKLSSEETIKIIEKGEYGVLSLQGNNDYPYSVPLSYVYHNNKIYFHCAMEGNKLDCIENYSRVCFCVVGNTIVLPEKFSTKYESVIIFGQAKEVYEDEKKEALIKIIEKYSKEYRSQGLIYIEKAISRTKVMAIEIEHMTGKARK